MRYRIGAHLSTAGGYHKALHKLKEIGGNCLQIFSTAPRGWRSAQVTEAQSQSFNDLRTQYTVDPVYFHASYLINLADDGKTGTASVKSLVHELNLALRLRVRGSIVHLGSFKDKMHGDIDLFSHHDKYTALLKNISVVLQGAPDNRLLVIENAGTRKIGQTLDEIGRIINDLKDARIKVCLDTCHLHAAGYDLTTLAKLDIFLSEFDKLIGLKRLELWHMNDSRDPLGSLRDRHENLGKGFVGIDVFNSIVNHPHLKHLPFIIETPGENKRGPNKENIDILKHLIHS